MFQSATVKLTGWYLLILMTISLLFSVAIFHITTNEVSTRLERLQNGIELQPESVRWPIDALRTGETAETSSRLLIGLLYTNMFILVAGGVGSYLLARRTLRPIEQSHEAQSRFTSDASHELRTPLATMKAEIEVALRDTSATKTDLEQTLKSTLEEVEKLSRLSNMLLSLSRLEHDKLERTAVDLRDITRTALKTYAQPTRRISLRASKQVLVAGNEPALIELISIFVDNALKYSPSDSTITVVVSKRGRHARIEVTNSGAGIAADKLPYIFDRFYRADTSRTKQSKQGYGLGLSLAKKIVEIHAGELSVTSTPGVSTTLTTVLPIFQKR